LSAAATWPARHPIAGSASLRDRATYLRGALRATVYLTIGDEVAEVTGEWEDWDTSRGGVWVYITDTSGEELTKDQEREAADLMSAAPIVERDDWRAERDYDDAFDLGGDDRSDRVAGVA
jgi:hypothetical protein